MIISAANSTVTLFTSDPAEAKIQPNIIVDGTLLPLCRTPKILGVTWDTYFEFHKHCNNVALRISKRNNILKALTGTTWGQQKETLIITYKALGRSIANYATPVWSPNTSYKKLQVAQNSALRIATGSHLMASTDHLHQETKMLTVAAHTELLAAQYLISCLEPNHPCHGITTRPAPPRYMKETLYSKHFQSVQPMLVANSKQQSVKAVHTWAVSNAINRQEPSVLLNGWPPPISKEENYLSRRQRTTLSQLQSNHCRLLNDYQHRLDEQVADRCGDSGVSPHDVRHLFNCSAHPTTLSPRDLWTNPKAAISELKYLATGLDE